jgi:DME family drug/metabolite transporter
MDDPVPSPAAGPASSPRGPVKGAPAGPGRPNRPAGRVPAFVRSRAGPLALAVTGILWGSIGVAVRLLQDASLSPPAIAFWRVVCACAVLAPLLGLRGMRELAAAARRPRRLLAVGVGSLGFQLLYFVAVRDVGVAVATLVTLGLAPVAVILYEAARDRRAPGPRTLAVLACALTGLALVASASGTDVGTAPRPLLGLAEATASALVYAGTTILSEPLSQRLGPFLITAGTSVIAVVLLLPAVLLLGPAVPLSPQILGGLIWLGVVTTVIAYGLFYAGLRTTPGSVAMVLTLLEPATAVVLAAVILGEPVTPAGGLGAALLLLAVAVLYLAAPRRELRGGPELGAPPLPSDRTP